MNTFVAKLAVAIPLALGVAAGSSVAHAQLGNATAAIGSAGEADAGPSEGRAAAPRVVGNCITNRTAYRTQSNSVSTTSPTFSTMPNTHFPVTHAAGCIIVDFSAMVLIVNSTERMLVRAWIGGIGAAEPLQMNLGRPASANQYETRSTHFVFPNVPAGTHTVRIEWRSQNGGNVGVGNRTLKVQYR
jgi:hypothetical protein